MNEIKIKRDFWYFYVYLFLITVFFIGLFGSMIQTSVELYLENSTAIKLILSIIAAVFPLALAIFTLIRYFRSTPIVKIDHGFIYFNREKHLLSDIKSVRFTGKQTFKYLLPFRLEGIAIHFNDGSTKYLYDELYANIWELKCALEYLIKGKEHKHIPSSISEEAFTSCEEFKDDQLTSLRGISLWGMILLLAGILLRNGSLPIGILVFLLFWFICNSWLMYWFECSNEVLIIRNHNFFWVRKVYNLQDIEEIVFETQGKMPNCLRVIMKDYQFKLYRAGTLRDRTWLQLKEKLEQQGIKVRNECIIQ